MTLLSICQDAATELGLRQPSFIVGSTDLTSQLFYRLANQGGKELMRYHDWQALTTEQTFTTTATVSQVAGALPTASFDRMLHNAELWNRSLNQRYSGPTQQRYWQQLKANVSVGGVTGWWRIINGALAIYPAPTTGETVAYEYIDKRWAQSATGTNQEKFLADTDVARISEDIITLEIIWRFRKSKGFQYAEDLATCEREKEKIAARDRGTGKIRPEGDTDGAPTPPFFAGVLTG